VKRDAHGKPQLAGVSRGVRFSLSHSGECALLAISVGREVGVDVEEHRPVDFLSLARSAFSPHERAALEELPMNEHADAFYRCWTRKESFIKARGDGLSFPLDGFDVSLDADAAQLLIACPASPEDVSRWTIRNLPANPGYSAAITVEAGSGHILIQEDRDAST